MKTKDFHISLFIIFASIIFLCLSGTFLRLKEEFLTVLEIFTVLRLKMSMPDSIEGELKCVKQLRDEGKFTQAFDLITKIEERNDLTEENQLTCLIFKGRFLGYNQHWTESVELGKKAYVWSQKLGNNEAMIDSLVNMTHVLYQGQVEEGLKLLTQMENLIKTIKNVSSEKINYWNVNLYENKSYCFLFQGDFDKALEFGMKALKYAEILGTNRSLGITSYLLGNVYMAKGDIDKAFMYYQQSIAIWEKVKNFLVISSINSAIGSFYYLMGEFDQSLKYLERSSAIKETSESAQLYNYSTLGSIFTSKGELNRGLEYQRKALVLAEKTPNKYAYALLLSGIGVNLRFQGDYNGATKYFEQFLEVGEELNNPLFIGHSIFRLLSMYLHKGDNENAQICLNRLKQNVGQGENLYHNPYFILGKALMLIKSKRISDIAEAERLLKEFLKEEHFVFVNDIFALTLLSEILLEELQMTNNLEILNEIIPLINKLQTIAEKQQSYNLISETNLLRAKLALIQNKTDDAQRLLSEAQRTADWHGLNYLAHKISKEHDKLLEQLDVWERINKTNAPMSERIKLASFDGVIDRLQEKRTIEPPKLETEQPILLAFLTKTGYLMFSNPFTADMTINENLFGGFISTLSSSSDQLFSEAIDRIKIGDYMVLLKKVEDFSICYVFRGESYSAGQKLQNFTEAVKENKSIIEILNTTVRTGHQIKLNENPDLEELITISFLADPKKFQLPFRAYKGDEPFIFVSYAHSDKLQAYPIMDYLNKSDFNIWYDEGISVSEDWIKSIVGNIEKCSAFLVFITPHIINSEYVRKEIRYALSKKKPFYSVYLKDTALPGELEFEISGIQSMKKYTMDDSEFYDKIKEVLSNVKN